MKSNRFLLHIAAYFRRIDKILWLLMLAIAAFSLLLLKSVSRATYTRLFPDAAARHLDGVRRRRRAFDDRL